MLLAGNYLLIRDRSWLLLEDICLLEGDKEELALTLNGKKKKLRKKDFLEAISRFDINAKAIEKMFDKFRNSEEEWHEFIDISFLPDYMKNSFHHLIKERVSKIYNSL